MVKLLLHSIAYEAKTLNLAKEGNTTFYVDGTDGNDINDGGSWGQAFKTIQHAMDESDSWATTFVKSRANSLLSGTAASGQKNVSVDDSSDFKVGDSVIVKKNTYIEKAVIASIAGLVLTMVDNLSESYAIIDDSIVICYYNETLTIENTGAVLIGEDRDTTVVLSEVSNSITSYNDDTTIEHIFAITGKDSKSAMHISGENSVCRHCAVDSLDLTNTNGLAANDNYFIAEDIKNCTPLLKYGVYLMGDHQEVFNCNIDGVHTGIFLQSCNYTSVHDNNVSNCTDLGLYSQDNCSHNSLYHNNLVNNLMQVKDYFVAGVTTTEFFENYYDDHVTDTDNNGIADTPYTSGTNVTDYSPVSKRNGWKQESIGNVASSDTTIGKTQIAATTIDLNQAAATYTLLTGTTQSVVLEKLILRMPNVGISGGSLTSISIQTDDVTPAVIINDASEGILANLTEEASLSWTGAMLIPVGTLIQLTIAGGAAGTACACDIVAESRAVVDGGYLT